MTGWRKRQVIELAERASPSKQDWWKDDDALEAFAALVREDERKRLRDEFPFGIPFVTQDELERLRKEHE